MFKNTSFIRTAICILCLFAFVIGCEDKAGESKQAGTVVSQKIKTKSPQKKPKQTTVSQAPEKTTPQKETKSEESSAETSTAVPDQQKIIPELALGYDPKGKIDPFVPLIKDEPIKVETQSAAKESEVPKKRVPTTPLEKIELSQLRLRAIIIAASGNKALVEESSGKGYIIEKGTFIGRNQGTVTKILKDKVVVEELVENIQGKMTIKEKELKLPKPPGEE